MQVFICTTAMIFTFEPVIIEFSIFITFISISIIFISKVVTISLLT